MSYESFATCKDDAARTWPGRDCAVNKKKMGGESDSLNGGTR